MEWYYNIFIGVGATLLGALIISTISWINRMIKRPLVLVHKASHNDTAYYFIKVINRSLKYDYTVTHIWIEPKEDEYISVFQSAPKLPHLIKPSEILEACIETSKVDLEDEEVFNNVKVRLSYGSVLNSEENLTVNRPGSGRVPDELFCDEYISLSANTSSNNVSDYPIVEL